MKLIPLSKFGRNKGKYFAKVDDDDYKYLNSFNWSAKNDYKTTYAHRSLSENGKQLNRALMHRDLLRINDKKLKIDHIDGDGLNNQRSNLRAATSSQNSMNRGKNKNSKSKYKGIYLSKTIHSYGVYYSWRVQIGIKNRRIIVCGFKSEENAATAYNILALKYHGKFAYQNTYKQ